MNHEGKWKTYEPEANVLDYNHDPSVSFQDSLVYTDQGSWFGFAFSDNSSPIGFAGPYLLTQDNGAWLSNRFIGLELRDRNGNQLLDPASISRVSLPSHLTQIYSGKPLIAVQRLFYPSPHTALIESQISNIGEDPLSIFPVFRGFTLDLGAKLKEVDNSVMLKFRRSSVTGLIQFLGSEPELACSHDSYSAKLPVLTLNPGEAKPFTTALSFLFPENNWSEEKNLMESMSFGSVLDSRIEEKNKELAKLLGKLNPVFSKDQYKTVIEKAHLTLQNNWRAPAEKISHKGLFPSYHYKGFNGFWAWDSWKHSAALVYFNTELAKDQVRLMFHYQTDDGFVPDCVFRDSSKNNYRDTKPPLAAWAVKRIYQEDRDVKFLMEIYPKLVNYHKFWYEKRDHDSNGLCEYGSTDGSLIAAKWESGMDNAVRFDNSQILKNMEGAYSLDQESVDLNSFLYLEKTILSFIADELERPDEAQRYSKDAVDLKKRIRSQFFHNGDGWFYDTRLDGQEHIRTMGSEGWTPLWAEVATQEQADRIITQMLNVDKFYTKVPFQTLSADHAELDPSDGYWRGPNWLDQAYFAVTALRNYGYHEEANKAVEDILRGADGLLVKGPSIRENYNPLTGDGLNAHNFSWSAAHILMMLLE